MLGRRTRAPRCRLSLRLGAAAAALAAAALGTAARADPAGPDIPPAGSALLTQLFPEGLPFPFEALIDRLRALVGPENVEMALIPLGRSLQRYAADPGYFASPRLVVAITGDHSAGPGTPRLADRIFLGYQPAADAIEAISYNEAAGRFEFQDVVGYSEGVRPEPADRRTCFACHQAQGPIFPRPLWSETNANPAIAGRLAPLGPSFHGAPVRQTVDGLEAFDAATDRANRLPLASRIWRQACPDSACRAALLAAALRSGFGGPVPPAPARFRGKEIAIPSPDLPNRDPLLDWDDAGRSLETVGRLNPETPRDALVLWSPSDGFPAAAGEIAAQFSSGDLAWIDGLLRRHAGPTETLTLPCTTTAATLPGGMSEARFVCAAPDVRLSGFRGPDGAGRLDVLALRATPAATDIVLPIAAARAPDGRRLFLALTDAQARLTLTDDLAALNSAIARRGGAALAGGPFPREAVLLLLADLLGGTDG